MTLLGDWSVSDFLWIRGWCDQVKGYEAPAVVLKLTNCTKHDFNLRVIAGHLLTGSRRLRRSHLTLPCQQRCQVTTLGRLIY